MRKMIKKLAILLFAFYGLSILSSNAYALSTTAPEKGIDVRGYSYLSDNSTDSLSISGSKYKYGEIGLWSAVYNYYYDDSDTMYYFVITESYADARGSVKSVGFFHTEEQYVKINAFATGIRQICYSPIQGQSTYSSTRTLNLGFQVGMDSNVSMGVSFSETLNLEEIQLIIHTTNNDNEAAVEFNYDFTRSRSSSAKYSPYVGLYKLYSVAVFEQANYSNCSDLVVFDVEYTGKIYRYSSTKAPNYLMGRDIVHRYAISNDSVVKTTRKSDAYDLDV